MLLLLERKNKSSTRPPSTSGQKSFVKRKDDHWLPFLLFPRYFGLTLNFNWSFVFFFFILGLGWVVVWCRHELVFVVDQSSHLCNPCSPSEEAESEGKNWKLKNIFQKIKKKYFSPRPATCRVDLERLMPCSRGGGESSLRTCLLQIQLWTLYLKYYLDKRK